MAKVNVLPPRWSWPVLLIGLVAATAGVICLFRGEYLAATVFGLMGLANIGQGAVHLRLYRRAVARGEIRRGPRGVSEPADPASDEG